MLKRRASNIWGGGIYNPRTGQGGRSDALSSAMFSPTIWSTRYPAETIYTESWVAAHAVDMPIDDMFIRWRTWDDDDAAGADRDLAQALNRAMRAGRQYGTAILVLVTAEAPMDTPLYPERIREGDLIALRVYDKYDISVTEWDTDPMSPRYGEPAWYDVVLRHGPGPMRVHPSRAFRFDGITPIVDRKWDSEIWGKSILIRSLTSITEDATLAASVAHMSQEASIPIVKISSLRDKISGAEGEEEATIEEIGRGINETKSVYRLLMLDKETEDFTRVPILFGALPDLLERYLSRVAAAEQIPQTRFLGRSPAGLSATGESDMKNYVMTIEAIRERMLSNILPILDEVVMRSAGISTVPDWEWHSLMDLSEQEVAQAAKTKVEALTAAVGSSIVDEDEARESLDGDPVFGALPGPAPEPLPEPAPGEQLGNQNQQ